MTRLARIIPAEAVTVTALPLIAFLEPHHSTGA
jgi:hypothetical protein